jgi:prepilin-type N-terminal cleavage/methylation domain-containing protein
MMRKNSRGFTLIEIIIAILLFSFMAVMVITFTLTNVWQSANPILNLIKAGDVQTGMDNVTRAYYNLPNPVSHGNLVTFNTNLANYINTVGITVNAGRTGFVTFPVTGGNQANDPSATAPNLKVTLINGQGQWVSTIFTTRQ